MQSAGQGFRLKPDVMMQGFNRAGLALPLLLRYTQALITHDADRSVQSPPFARPATGRCLLLSLDLLQSTELLMTQELIANMIGVRRQTATEASGRLHKAPRRC